MDSGIRAVFGYTIPTRMSKWDQLQCVPEQDLIPEWSLKQLGDLSEKHNIAESNPAIIAKVEAYLRTARTTSVEYPIE